MADKEDKLGTIEKERDTETALSHVLWGDFSSCRLTIEVLKKPSLGIPKAFPIGDMTLTFGLAESNIIHSLGNAINGQAVGTKLKFTCDVGHSVDDASFNCQVKSLESDDHPTESNDNAMEFSVLVKDCEVSRNIDVLRVEEKFQRACRLKSAGTTCFKLKNSDLAFRHYSRALKYCFAVKLSNENEDVILSELEKIMSQCYFNLAACHLLRGSPEAVVYCCTKGLQCDKQNVKGFFRRSQAFFDLGLMEEALSDAKIALEIDPNNKAIFKHFTILKECQKNADDGLAQAMTKYFE